MATTSVGYGCMSLTRGRSPESEMPKPAPALLRVVLVQTGGVPLRESTCALALRAWATDANTPSEALPDGWPISATAKATSSKRKGALGETSSSTTEISQSTRAKSSSKPRACQSRTSGLLKSQCIQPTNSAGALSYVLPSASGNAVGETSAAALDDTTTEPSPTSSTPPPPALATGEVLNGTVVASIGKGSPAGLPRAEREDREDTGEPESLRSTDIKMPSASTTNTMAEAKVRSSCARKSAPSPSLSFF
mmetsp:Transcript_29460/g.63412  ORF Transcript_29460/g.63412 Transcript_29460/m.63412 type:complete len:251 (+) Transcript_29460:316-1068(+)